jgi:hypothetical protein
MKTGPKMNPHPIKTKIFDPNLTVLEEDKRELAKYGLSRVRVLHLALRETQLSCMEIINLFF